jgi:hypothetical protein
VQFTHVFLVLVSPVRLSRQFILWATGKLIEMTLRTIVLMAESLPLFPKPHLKYSRHSQRISGEFTRFIVTIKKTS